MIIEDSRSAIADWLAAQGKNTTPGWLAWQAAWHRTAASTAKPSIVKRLRLGCVGCAARWERLEPDRGGAAFVLCNSFPWRRWQRVAPAKFKALAPLAALVGWQGSMPAVLNLRWPVVPSFGEGFSKVFVGSVVGVAPLCALLLAAIAVGVPQLRGVSVRFQVRRCRCRAADTLRRLRLSEWPRGILLTGPAVDRDTPSLRSCFGYFSGAPSSRLTANVHLK